MRRPSLLLLAFVALVAGLPAIQAAAAAGPTPATGTVAEARDFATIEWGDPWDMGNTADLLTDEGGPAIGVHGPTWTGDGRFAFTSGSGGFTLNPLWVTYPTALAAGREGPRHPVNAERFTRLSLRLYSDREAFAAIQWFRCREFVNECLGGHRFVIQPGWHTYDLELVNEFPGLPQPWASPVLGFRVVASQETGHTEIDWIRLYQPGGDVKISNAGGSTVYWDRDTDVGNNTGSNPNWGPVGGGKNPSFATGAYPPGTYHLYTAADGYGGSITVAARPAPVIDDPDDAGGGGFVWDMSDPSQAAELGNVTDVQWSGGQLHATNASNDPYVRLAMGGALDPALHHRLTVRYTYDGPFGLEDAVNGGTHGRLLWRRADQGDVWQDGTAIVTYTTVDEYTTDLAQAPSVVAEAGPGWLGSAITALRWDANEDRGARRWHLDEVALRADDHAPGGVFDIRWHDDRTGPNSRVSLYYDTDRGGNDGLLIAEDLVQQPGQNTYRWETGGLGPGSYWVYAVVTNGSTSSTAYATGPLVIDGTGPVATPLPGVTDARIAGPGRIETALEVSRTAFPDGADAAIVARADDFPDALAAAPLASAVGAPVLLNHRDTLDAGVQAEIERLGARTVYLMGGHAAQTPAVEQQLARPGVSVVRVSGLDRYGTAADAARRAVELWRGAGDADAGRHALVALGTNFPDALAAGPLAGYAHRPLLLVGKDDVPSATRETLDALGVTEVTVVGGPGAISEGTRQSLGSGGRTTHRMGGASRYGTAQLAADAAVAAGADGTVALVGTGRTYPDALAAGPAAVELGGVVLLVDRDALVPETRQYLAARRGAMRVLRVAGGRGAVTDPVVATMQEVAGLR